MKKMNFNRIMTSVALLTGVTVGIPNALKAQKNEFHYGTRVGLGESQLDFSKSSAESGKLALVFGVSSSYQFNNFIGASADFLFSSKGGKRDGVTTTTGPLGMQREFKHEDTYRLFYAELPIVFTLRLPITESFYLKGFTGPSINFKLAGTESRAYDDDDFDEDNGYSNRNLDDLETVDYSFVYGAGVDIVAEDDRIFFLDFRLNNALGSSGKIQNSDVENNYFLISAGYLF